MLRRTATVGAPHTTAQASTAPTATMVPEHPAATIVPLRGDRTPVAGVPGLGWAAVLAAGVLAASPLADGYFDFNWWGAIALGTMVLLVVLAGVARPSFTRHGAAALAGFALLLALSAASILWSESRDSAWTEVNRLALYASLFAVAVLTVRDRRTARAVVMVLGSAALLASLWLCLSMLFGGSQSAFLTRRLNAPVGYINGTACLLVMGVWPWLACAEAASKRGVRAAALAGATLIAGTVVLTQSRAVVPAIVLSAVLVIACTGGRTRRAVNLILLALAVAATLPWTLAVYSTGGAAGRLALPAHGLLRAAAGAILLAALSAGVARLALGRAADRLEPARRQRAMHRLGWALATGALAAIAIGSVVEAPFITRQYRAFTALRVDQNAATRFTDASGYRYDLWRVAVHEFANHPLGGLGAGNYDAAYYRLRRNPQYVVAPHSLELQVAAELGVGGIVALILLCGAILAACWARRKTLASGDRLVKVAAAGMFVAFLVDTSVDWTYDIPGLAGAAILAGALLVLPERATGAVRRRRSRREQAGVVVALTVLALLAASIGRQYAASRYQQAGAAEIASSPRAAISTLTEAQKLDPYSLPTFYSLAAAYARQDNYQAARDVLLSAQQVEPESYVAPALLGDLAVRRGDTALAAREYRRALSLNPRDPTLRRAVAAQ